MTLLLSLDRVQVSQELLQQIRETVLQKTVDGMREEGAPYVGKCSFSSSVMFVICLQVSSFRLMSLISYFSVLIFQVCCMQG